jgi:tRNA(fMet)-specific endonuclease VapC
MFATAKVFADGNSQAIRLPKAFRVDVDDNRRRTIDLLLNEIPVLPWTLEAADRYGEIAAHLQQTGQPIGQMDTQIAAHALALGLPLVTHNTWHFKRVEDLKLEDWMD